MRIFVAVLILLFSVVAYGYDWDRGDKCFLIKRGMWKALYPQEVLDEFDGLYCQGLLYGASEMKIPYQYYIFMMEPQWKE